MTLGQWLLSLGYPLSGDLTLDGYRSENWGAASTSEDAINMWLGDEPHTNTMLSVERSDIGAGVAVGDQIYVVLETALRTSSGKMQYEASSILTGIPMTQGAYSGQATLAAENGTLPQYSIPVGLNTPLPNGDVYHEVKYGQTLWSIAVAYHSTVKQIQQWNNLFDTNINVGMKLLVARGATQSAPVAAPETTPAPGQDQPVMMPTGEVYRTPTISPTPVYSEEERRKDAYGIWAIGFAALFLGGLFAVMFRAKPTGN